MFEKLKYQRATKDYFRPHESIDVNEIELLKILRGEVVNPRRLENVKTSCDFDYYLISVPKGSPLNSWAGQTWGPNCFEIAEADSNWYGRFFCERESHIVIPNAKASIQHAKSIYKVHGRCKAREDNNRSRPISNRAS